MTELDAYEYECDLCGYIIDWNTEVFLQPDIKTESGECDLCHNCVLKIGKLAPGFKELFNATQKRLKKK